MNMKYIIGLTSLVMVLLMTSCKKDKDPRIPPDMVFKTGSGYISADAVVNLQDTLTVGIIATKTEDDLKSFNVSYAYDGSATTTTFYNYYLQSSEINSYSHDVQIITRNQAGSERWVFSIVDRDGNITQKSITLTVQ